MSIGNVISIHLTPATGQQAISVSEAHAAPGKGLEGDRYYLSTGRYSHKFGPDREITLIETEALEKLAREQGIELSAAESRRNVATRGVALNDLVEREFFVGEVRLRGVKLCHPCEYLEGLTQPGVLAGLTMRGGLRAQILTEGTIRVGDEIRPPAEA